MKISIKFISRDLSINSTKCKKVIINFMECSRKAQDVLKCTREL